MASKLHAKSLYCGMVASGVYFGIFWGVLLKSFRNCFSSSERFAAPVLLNLSLGVFYESLNVTRLYFSSRTERIEAERGRSTFLA